MADIDEKDGKWVTLDNGVHLFIKKGQTLDDAIEKLDKKSKADYDKKEKKYQSLKGIVRDNKSEKEILKEAIKQGHKPSEIKTWYDQLIKDEGYNSEEASSVVLDKIRKTKDKYGQYEQYDKEYLDRNTKRDLANYGDVGKQIYKDEQKKALNDIKELTAQEVEKYALNKKKELEKEYDKNWSADGKSFNKLVEIGVKQTVYDTILNASSKVVDEQTQALSASEVWKEYGNKNDTYGHQYFADEEGKVNKVVSAFGNEYKTGDRIRIDGTDHRIEGIDNKSNEIIIDGQGYATEHLDSLIKKGYAKLNDEIQETTPKKEKFIDSADEEENTRWASDIDKYANHYGYNADDAHAWVDRRIGEGASYRQAVEEVRDRMASYDSLAEKYKGYPIEHNFYGRGEYTVQFEGDDVLFDQIEDAKKFIDEQTRKK